MEGKLKEAIKIEIAMGVAISDLKRVGEEWRKREIDSSKECETAHREP